MKLISQYEYLLKILRRLADGKIPHLDGGICINLSQGYLVPPALWKPVMEEACKSWESYSGNMTYPIKLRTIDSEMAYYRFEYKWNLNSLSSRSYAKLRYELVDRMIKVVESKLSLLS